ncbi:FUSC family protein [Scleromatobacter humisilvae]|uniref:FUSC family protein n=1 Tax=Scleromatobacter humisilvae TaxID=2897159 RepID=A0A9X1YJE6_9BURK|nr:FUSC family protein [Scleromatobacter humisilvae]MCK9687248.1 FUSC family protein [Scleromatobacter humisilvae]
MKLPSLPRFSGAEILFSAKSFAAAVLAMYIASRAGLPRPFWALLTSYIVSAPLAGNVRSKAVFRFCGTLIGCIATVLMVPAFANAPELLTLALALWVGTCLFLSLQDRTARSYLFMLAGYTAALIGFPSVETPAAIFDTAVARVEEISLGILSATLVHSLVLPVGMGPTLLAVLDRGLGDARRWFADVLREPGAAAKPLATDRQRLAGDITQLRLLSTHVPFDTSHLRWTAGAIGAMQDALAALTPALSAVENRLLALEEAEGTLAPDVTALLARTAAWLRADAATAQDAALDDLLAELRALGADAATCKPWARALRISLAVRLEELIHGWRDAKSLRRDIDAGLAGAVPPRRHGEPFGNRVLHKDVGLALLSSFAAVLAICLCCAAWIVAAWPAGSAAAMFAAVFCSFFATMDDPVPAIRNFMRFMIWSVPVSALYVLVLLPLVHDFGMLVLVIAPTFLVLGLFIARAATAPSALAMLFGVAGTLSIHDTQATVDLPVFLNSTLAQVLGIFAAALVTRLVRTVGADWSAQRIRRATWNELGAMADAGRGAAVDDAYAVRMVDRIALLAPRVVQADAAVRNDTVEGALSDLRSGLDIVALQRARPRLPSMGIGPVMQGVARLFRSRGQGRDDPPPAALLAELDGALQGALGKDGIDGRVAVTALVGLRRTLFPGAPAALAPVATGASA